MTIAPEDMAELSEEESRKVKLLLEKGIKIPPQPRVLNELRDCITSGDYDMRSLARIVSQDTGLVSLLFKASRSFAYRNHHPFDSVTQILQTIGVKQAFNLVQGAALSGVMQIKSNPKAYEAYWARSGIIAQLAMLIADERITVCNIFPDQAYLAGIFHDCGVPVLMQRFPTYCKTLKLDDPCGWTDLAEEDKRFNADHCVVGYLVGRHWKLPDFICEAIRYHHDMMRLDNHDSRTMVAILQLAINLYHRVMHVTYPEWSVIGSEVLAELCIHADDAEEFMDDILERFQSEQDQG